MITRVRGGGCRGQGTGMLRLGVRHDKALGRHNICWTKSADVEV